MSSTSIYTGSSSYQPTSATSTSAPTKTLGQDDYLKLMAEELKNQDPLEPMDNKEFLTQMAQFSSLEQMNNIAGILGQLQGDISGMYQQSLLTQGASLLGKEVEGTDLAGQQVKGVVDKVSVLDGTVFLQIGDQTVDLYSVTEVTESGL